MITKILNKNKKMYRNPIENYNFLYYKKIQLHNEKN